MKKILISLLSFIIILISKDIFAISDEFKFVIDTVGIPEYNVYNEQINEQIYYTYNIFSYSDPIRMFAKTNTQRFKEVPDYGKWCKEGGPYKGTGIRGEYYVLGTSYSGSIIDNVYFPVDSVPETTPNNWNFLSFDGAYSSWSDSSIYKYPEQLQYMKNTQLLFDDINLKNNTSNSYNLVEYGITPSSVGLDKTRLNTYSTWKTMGIVSAKRINNRGEKRNAIFATRPMAASADVVSKLSTEDEIILDNENTNKIKVSFGSSAINLNNYAVPKHIKEITSILYINGKEYSRISGSKTVNLDKEIFFTVPKEIYDNPKNQSLNLKVLSYLYTEFSVDGLMKNIIEKNITIKISNKPVVPINYIDIKIMKKNNNNLVVSPLVQTLVTNSMNSKGMLEAGRNLAIKINSNVIIDENSIGFYINDSKVESNFLIKQNNSYIYKVNLNNKLENTLKSWNYLRNITGDYFKVDFSEVGKRVKEPNSLKVKFKYENKEYEEYITFDSIDEFLINIGYEFSNDVINLDEIYKEEKLDEWIK